MFGLFVNKHIKKIIKSLDIDYAHWRICYRDDKLINEINKIEIKFGIYSYEVKSLVINDKNAKFLLTPYNRKYLSKAIKRWKQKLEDKKADDFEIKISTDNPEDFI